MLTSVFEPRRVALVGASDRAGTVARLLWENLQSFPGEMLRVGCGPPDLDGPAPPARLTDLDGDVDLAVVVVPAEAVTGVVADAGAKGVPAVVVISGGFAESGADGTRRQEELLAAAREGGVRVIGPNSFGVQNCDLPLNASLAAGLARGGGGISLVTQSGAYGMAIHTLGRDEHVGFAKMCATGNKADVADADLLAYLGEDPATRTLCFLSESMPDGRAFVEVARRVTPHKPVIVATTGRSASGARAAFSHTAALASPPRLARAALESSGVIVVDSGLEMLDVARALDSQPLPAGTRAAIVTNSGGTGVELTDLLSDEGVLVPELSAALMEQLDAVLPALGSPRNPVDLTTVWRRFVELYPAVLDRLARSGEVDLVIPVLLQRSADRAVAAAVAKTVDRLRADGITVPVYVCWVAERANREGADLLQEAGIPCFDWPQRTAQAVGHVVRYAAARSDVRPVPEPRPLPALPQLADGVIDAACTAELLTAAGIEILDAEVCVTVDEAVSAAVRLGFPVVAKLLHPEVTHKSDVGGVRLGLGDVERVRAAARELLSARAGAHVLVQRQGDGLEVAVGGLRDARFGPAVLVGMGGVLVDVLDDTLVAPAPLSEGEARALLTRLRGYPLLRGVRGGAGVDLAALARLVSRVGDLLVAAPEVDELDLNPVLCTSSTAVAADWRLKAQNRSSGDQAQPSDSPPHAGETKAPPS